MGSGRMYFARSFLAVVGLLCLGTYVAASPGFGTLRKKTLELNIRQPARVRLANTSIAFRGSASNPEYGHVVASLLATLGTELVANEKTLIEKDKPADATWVLGVMVTGYSMSPPRQHTEGSGNTAMTYTRWNGSLNVAYQVIDHFGRVHDAGNVSSTYDKEFPSSAMGSSGGRATSWIPMLGKKGSSSKERIPSTVEDVKQDLIKDVVVQIAAKLGNTTQAVEVQVATGDTNLDRAAEFMTQHLWSRAVDELEKTPAFPKPDQEAYRQYDLGLAYEAISYSSSSADDQKENIYKAAEYYDKALEMNSKEKYFVATVARTRDALARYKDLEAMAKQDKTMAKTVNAEPERTESLKERTEVPKVTPANDIVPSTGHGHAAKTLTVSDVIEMYNGKVPDDQILEVIQASQVEFDPHDKDTVIAIAKAKLPIRIQNALRAKVGAPLLASPRPQPRAAAAKTTQ